MDKTTFKLEIKSSGFLLCLCLFLFFWGLETIPFYTRGEPREGLVVWEMYRTGNWILPLINGDYIPHKPPLFHWVGVLVAMVAGRVDEFVVRFPSALFGTLGVLMTYYVARRWWGRRSGLVVAVVLATSFEWWRAATLTQVDMALAFLVSAALMFFYFVYREEHLRTMRALVLAALVGLATLAKGPLGVALPSLVVLAFLLVQRDLAFLRKLPLVSGAAVFLLIASSWYGLAFLQQGGGVFRRQIVDETLLTGVGSYGHHQPLYYFVPALFHNMLPWSFFFPGVVVFLYQRRRRLTDEHLLYPLIWFVAMFFFFSMSRGKREIYILPLYPAVALLFGAWWSAMEQGTADGLRIGRWLGFAYAISSAVALAVISIYLMGQFGRTGRSFAFPSGSFGAFVAFLNSARGAALAVGSVVLLGACLLMLAWFLLQIQWRGVFGCLTVIALTQAIVMKDGYLPYVASQRTMKPFLARVTQHVEPKSPLLFYRAFDYGTLFYSHRHIPSYATRFTELRRPYFLLMWEEDLKRLSETNRFEILDTSEGRGPAGRHRLVLVEPQQESPIIDPQGYGDSNHEETAE